MLPIECRLTSVSKALRTTYKETVNANLQKYFFCTVPDSNGNIYIHNIRHNIDLSPSFVRRIFIEVHVLKLLFDN